MSRFPLALFALFALTLVLLGSAGTASAQQPDTTTEKNTIGSVDFGGRLFDVTGDAARDERYRDLRSGPVVDRFRYNNDEKTWVFSAAADHVGYRDQRYFADYRKGGTITASFEWNQIPLFNSTITQTPYTQVSPGVFRIDNSLRQGIQAGTLNLSNAEALAHQFDLRSSRDIAAFHLTVSPNKNLDLKLNVTSTSRKGAQPWAMGFGFSNVVEVAAPLNHRTTDVGTALEWANSQGLIRIGYDGSWFRNPIESLVVDNPLRVTDTTSDTSQGRMALWPSSSSNAINTAGSIKFPGRSRATAYISVGDWKQNAALIPFTINTAITPIPLPRPTAEADARITAMNYNVTSSPINDVWLNARFKRYNFDNRTPVFPVTNYVRTDQAVSPSILGGSEPLGYLRNNLDADASFTPIPFTALRAGYGREEITRTHRLFERTTENTLRGTIDFSGSALFTVRTIYEHSKRTGTGLDEQVLDSIGEQVSLQQFDIADRDRDRVSAVLQFTPIQQFGITGSIVGGNDRRPGAVFGLTHDNNRTYAISLDAVPGDGATFGVSYGFEDHQTVQNSRQANPGDQFNDPTRNWSTNGTERVHTANISGDLLKLAPKTEVHFSYDFSHSRGQYLYVLPVNTTLAPVSQLPSLFNELQHGVVDVRYLVRPNMNLGLVYWYDRYKLQDFALGIDTLNKIDMTTGVLLLDNAYRPYKSSTVTLRMTYLW
ncbi:MAG TPA: MtrB/PioB family outer membrane beta-barrel protein [Vicinamibacterales bacterium]|jgi:MtrB/PioB family decaheme-associated outer membrane protein|nr:MtrB/PioB family outer membrane beta-barrel protein [Vicinamibacterales bacterium]